MSSVQWDQIVLDGTGKTPLYKQISKKIEQLVHEGKLKPGTRLPSERRMAELLKVSRALDGAEAARFLQTIASYAEEPLRLLLKGEKGT